MIQARWLETLVATPGQWWHMLCSQPQLLTPANTHLQYYLVLSSISKYYLLLVLSSIIQYCLVLSSISQYYLIFANIIQYCISQYNLILASSQQPLSSSIIQDNLELASIITDIMKEYQVFCRVLVAHVCPVFISARYWPHLSLTRTARVSPASSNRRHPRPDLLWPAVRHCHSC